MHHKMHKSCTQEQYRKPTLVLLAVAAEVATVPDVDWQVEGDVDPRGERERE